MKIKIELKYPQKGLSRETFRDAICDLMPEFGANYERRINSILFWHDGKLRTLLKRPADFILFDGKIEVVENNNEFLIHCERDYPSWTIYIPIIAFAIVSPFLWYVIAPIDLIAKIFLTMAIILFICVPLINYFLLAPYFFKWAMIKLIENALDRISAPNNAQNAMAG